MNKGDVIAYSLDPCAHNTIIVRNGKLTAEAQSTPRIGLQKMYVLIRKRAFYLAASHRQIKIMTSLRPLRLRGELI
jgi:hypothetical protein